MISKHIVLSMIVIGCLVQFITCPSPAGNVTQKKPNSERKLSSNNIPQSNPPQGAKKFEVTPAMKTRTQSRGLPNEGSKKLEASNSKNKNIKSILENEDLDEQNPPGRIRRTITILNGIRKKFCPLRLLFKAVKKTKDLGTNMLETVKIIKKK